MQMRLTAIGFLIFSIVLIASSGFGVDAPNQITEEEKAGGWKLLFDGKTTQGWHSFKKHTFPEKGWDVRENWLHGAGKGGGDILSDGEFDQFELQWEWKQAPGGNSGLKYFVLESRNSPLGHEYQMVDDEREEDARVYNKHATASFYDVLKPTIKPSTKPAGQINHSRIVVKGNGVEHWLNGVKVVSYQKGSSDYKQRVAATKFKDYSNYGELATGHIMLTDHDGDKVYFRNIRIRRLE